MISTFSRVAAVLALAGWGSLCCADDARNDLLRRLPATANTVAIVNVKALRESAGGNATALVAGQAFPPTIDMVVYASHVEPGGFQPNPIGGLVLFNRDVALKEFAGQGIGEVVDVGDMIVLDLGRRGRAFQLAPNLIGFGRQMNHQDLFRWKQFAEKNDKAALQPYLIDAISSASDAAIVGAVDLEHMIDLKATCDRVAEAKAAEGFNKDRIEGCSALLASLKGVRLTVSGKQLDKAEVRMDFNGDVGKEGNLVKSMFLEALDDLGAAIEDFKPAKVTVSGRTVTLDARLSEGGLTRIMSLFAPPPPPPPAAPPKLLASGVSVEATGRYFRAVDRLLDSLKFTTKNSGNYIRSAMWHDLYADRIEDLDTRYVDGDVVKYTQSLLARLRTLAWSLRGVVVEVNALEKGMIEMINVAGVTPQMGWNPRLGFIGPRWLGGSSGGISMQTDTNIPQLRMQQAEIVRKDAARRVQIWESIDQDRRSLLKAERERYSTDLTQPGR